MPPLYAVGEFAEHMEPTLGAGYDNPETSLDLSFNYLPRSEGFDAVSHDACGITIDKPYVFRVKDENHPDMYD